MLCALSLSFLKKMERIDFLAKTTSSQYLRLFLTLNNQA